jgi:hypothetical protein
VESYEAAFFTQPIRSSGNRFSQPSRLPRFCDWRRACTPARRPLRPSQGGRKAMSRILWAFVGACVVTAGLSAQSYPQGQGGATTPDRQPPSTQAPPTQAPPATPPSPGSASAAAADKKVTYSGCIERQPASAAAVTGAPTMPFTLTNASAVGAGAPVATSGSAAAKSYRLDGTEAMLTPHVGHKVEVTGAIVEQPASAAAGATASSNAPAARLKVDSVKMVSTTCP